ncbi:MAG: putative aminoacrylate hydrolase RutD [Xanthomonadales bacterium]|nr:putative aminoacrylate hydrolase RutD [Xanthomonadales bacterium]
MSTASTRRTFRVIFVHPGTRRRPTPTVLPYLRRFGAGPPLLLIHGLGSSGEDWAFQITPLAGHFHLLVPDLPGCGRSVAYKEVSIAGHAVALWALMDALGFDRIGIAGFSMGGAVALEMTLQQPHRVTAMATINSLPSYRVDHWRKWLELNTQLALVRLLGLPRTARMVARRMFPHAHQAAMRKRVVEVVGRSQVEPYLRCAQALAAWCAADRCEDFATRMLMLVGELDYTPLAEKRNWARRLRAELRVVAGSRHGTPFDAIGACNRALIAFFTNELVPDGLRADTPDETPITPPELPAQN